MIRKKDLILNYWTFYGISMLGFLPIDFTVATGKLRILTEGRRLVVWKFWLVNGVILASFKMIRLASHLLMGQKVVMQQLCFHIATGTFAVMCTLWHLLIFIGDRSVNEFIFNQLNIQDERNVRSRKRYSIQEWLILYLPFLCFFVYSLAVESLHIHDPTGPEHIFSILPKNYQTNSTLLVLVVYETLIHVYLFAVVYYGDFVKLAFIQNTKDKIEDAIRFVTRELSLHPNLRMMSSECRKLRRMELTIILFNKAFSGVIFFCKIFLIMVSTAFWYGTITFIDHPIYGIIYFVFAFSVTPFFVIMYDKAFVIPQLVNKWKSKVNFVSGQMVYPSSREYVTKWSHSIPTCGIKVGHFHTLERVSSPLFIDFTIRQVVGLLVTFPKQP